MNPKQQYTQLFKFYAIGFGLTTALMGVVALGGGLPVKLNVFGLVAFGMVGSIYVLARAVENQNREAIEIYKKKLARNLKTHVATIRSYFGSAFGPIMMRRRSIEYYQRALAIHEKVYRLEHSVVATDASNLGGILQSRGNLEAALAYFHRALAIHEKGYGPEHPVVATDASNLGEILQSLGNLTEAFEYFHRALAIHEKVYGPEHPVVATDASNLGGILQSLGNLEAAFEYSHRALAIFEKAFGHAHPKTEIVRQHVEGLTGRGT